MHSFILIFLASLCGAFSNFFFRKNTCAQASYSSPTGYLLSFYLFAFVASFFFYPELLDMNVNPLMLIVGCSVGFLSSFLMFLTSRALISGPSGLTFAFQNASAVFPGAILFMLLGPDFGFSFSFMQLIGILLVIFGIFLGAVKVSSTPSNTSSKWIYYAGACFLVQSLALTLMQGRCVLFDCAKLDNSFASLMPTEAQDIWFMPGQFGAALLVQIALFFSEKRIIKKSEIVLGSLGGFANFGATCCLMLATKWALPAEKGLLFPFFAVGTLALCNIWANQLYKEELNLKANAVCIIGIVLGVAS
ncbi:MAG: hypothetical protein H0X51_03565 [Parachlamydiaceae bacterium]|nr:hypothetical protein [Parachlamydiaceae bacterium]